VSEKKRLFLVVSIVVITLNLRAPISSVGSLITMIQADYGLSSALCGMLTTLPVVAFSVCSPLVTLLNGKIGTELTMLLGFLLTFAGVLVGSLLGVFGLFLGTAMVGMGISCANVLMPGIIKSKFSDCAGLIVGIYCAVMYVSSGIGAGISVPLAVKTGLGWKGSLASWSLLSVLAVLFWVPQLKGHLARLKKRNGAKTSPTRFGPLLKSPLAWAVTGYSGLQSLIFFCASAWLPAIFQSYRLSAETAGYLVLYLQLVCILGSCIVPISVDRTKDQRIISAAVSLSYFLGSAGLLFFPQSLFAVFVSLSLFGIGMGGCFSFMLIILGKRTKSASDTARLSGMAQSLGYLFASAGPWLFGAMFDLTGSWTVPLSVFALSALMLFMLSFYLGRDIYLFEEKVGAAPAERQKEIPYVDCE